jgi:hypothetical protein
MSEKGNSMLILFSYGFSRVGHEENQIAIFQSSMHSVHHAFIEERLRVMNARGINENDLGFGRCQHTLNRRACGLGLVCSDGELLAH